MLRDGGVVLAVGDFNGPLAAAAAPPEDALRATRAAPPGPTQYGTPWPVDGAVAFARASDAPALTLCCETLPPGD